MMKKIPVVRSESVPTIAASTAAATTAAGHAMSAASIPCCASTAIV